MDNRAFAKRTLIVLGLLMLAVLMAFVVIRARALLVVVFAAWIAAETLEIPVRFFRRKMNRLLAVLLTLLLTLIVVALLVLIIVPPVIEELVFLFEVVEDFPTYIEQAQVWYDGFRTENELLRQILPPAPRDLSELSEGIGEEGDILLPALEQTLPILTNISTAAGLVIGQIVLFIFITVLFMLEPDIYYNTLIDLIPARRSQRAREILGLVRRNVNTWSGALLLSVAMTSMLYFVMLGLILRLPNALALSVIAGIATIIPTIGNTLALIPVVIVAAPLGLTRTILAIVLYAAVGTLQDRVVTPSIMRSELSIPAAAQVIFQFVLSVLIGPVGFLLAVPLLAILITLVRELYVVDVLGKHGEKRENLPEDTEQGTAKSTVQVIG
jgi:predicted PurR-regulated permease PerM